MSSTIKKYLLALLHAFIGGEKLLINALADFEKLTEKLEHAAAQITVEVDKSFEITDELSAKMSAEYDKRDDLYESLSRANAVKSNVLKLLGHQPQVEDPFAF